MSQTLEHVERTDSLVIHPSLSAGSSMVKSAPKIDDGPKVAITGDIRLQVTELYAARKPVRGHYNLETDGMQSPLHVIWMIDGHVLSHSAHHIEVAFDMRGKPVGETLTRQLTVQVTEKGGQGCVVHSSVFVQIVVVHKEMQVECITC